MSTSGWNDDEALDRALSQLGHPPAATPRMEAGAVLARAVSTSALAAGIGTWKLSAVVLLALAGGFGGGYAARSFLGSDPHPVAGEQAPPAPDRLPAAPSATPRMGEAPAGPPAPPPVREGAPGGGPGPRAGVRPRGVPSAAPTTGRHGAMPTPSAPADPGPAPASRRKEAALTGGMSSHTESVDDRGGGFPPGRPDGRPAADAAPVVAPPRSTAAARPEAPTPDPAPQASVPTEPATSRPSPAPETPRRSGSDRRVVQIERRERRSAGPLVGGGRVWLAGGATGGLSAWQAASGPAGPALRGGLQRIGGGPSAARPYVGGSVDATVLAVHGDRAARFATGLALQAGVSVGGAAARLDLGWALGGRLLAPVGGAKDPADGATAGWLFAETGPELTLSLGGPGANAPFRLSAFAHASALDLDGDGDVELAPWFGIQAGAEFRLPGGSR